MEMRRPEEADLKEVRAKKSGRLCKMARLVYLLEVIGLADHDQRSSINIQVKKLATHEQTYLKFASHICFNNGFLKSKN